MWLQRRTYPLDGQLILEQSGEGRKRKTAGLSHTCPAPSFTKERSVGFASTEKKWLKGQREAEELPKYTSLHMETWPWVLRLSWEQTPVLTWNQCLEVHSSMVRRRFCFVDSSWKERCLSFLASLFNHTWLCQVLLDTLRWRKLQVTSNKHTVYGICLCDWFPKSCPTVLGDHVVSPSLISRQCQQSTATPTFWSGSPFPLLRLFVKRVCIGGCVCARVCSLLRSALSGFLSLISSCNYYQHFIHSITCYKSKSFTFLFKKHK